MKKKLFLGLVATALLFTACKKEEAPIVEDHDHGHHSHEHVEAEAESHIGHEGDATPCDTTVNTDGEFALQGEGSNTGCTITE